VANNISDGNGGVVKVGPATGAQTLVASSGFFTDPMGITMDTNGDILVADFNGSVIRQKEVEEERWILKGLILAVWH